MSVNNSYQIDVFISDGETTRLNFNFFIFQKENVKIKVIDNENNTTELVYGEDYTVENQVDYSSGGYINLTEAEPQNYSIVIYRETGIVQEINLRNLQAISPTNLTKMFDKLTIICQEINDQFYRSLKFDYSQISLIDQSIPLDEVNLKNIDPTVNPNKTVAIVLKYNEETGKYILTTSTRNPDDIQTQEATEIVLGMVRLATVEEALEGIENSKVMTPYKNQAHFESKKATTEEIESGANVYKYLNPAQMEIEKGKILEITRKELAEEAAIRADDDDQLQENIDTLEEYLHEYYYQNSLIDSFLNKKQNLLVNGDTTKLTLTDNEETDTTTITVLSDPTKQGKLINGDPNTLSLVDNPDGTTTITALGGGGEATRPMFELFERMEYLNNWRDWKGFVPLDQEQKIYKAASRTNYGYPDFYQKCLQEYQASVTKINQYWKYKYINSYSSFTMKDNYDIYPLVAGAYENTNNGQIKGMDVYFFNNIEIVFADDIIIGNKSWYFDAGIYINNTFSQGCGIMKLGRFRQGDSAMFLNVLAPSMKLRLGISTDGYDFDILQTSDLTLSMNSAYYIRLSYNISTQEYKVIVSRNEDFSEATTYISVTGAKMFNSSEESRKAYSNGVIGSNELGVQFFMNNYKIRLNSAYSEPIYGPGYYKQNSQTGRIYYDARGNYSYYSGSSNTAKAIGVNTDEESVILPQITRRQEPKQYSIFDYNNTGKKLWDISIEGNRMEAIFYVTNSSQYTLETNITLKANGTKYYFPEQFSNPPTVIYGGQKIASANSPLIKVTTQYFEIGNITDSVILNGIVFIGNYYNSMRDTPVTTYMSTGGYVSS